MRVEAPEGGDPARWSVDGRPLTEEEVRLVQEADDQDFADAAALLRADAEIDVSGAHDFTREATIEEVCSGLATKLAIRVAPAAAEEFVRGLGLPEGQRDQLLQRLRRG